MAYTRTEQTDAEFRPVPTRVSRLGHQVDLTCMMCGRTVGQIVEGKARQHAGCAGRLRVERGVLRCCHCSGQVYRNDAAALG